MQVQTLREYHLTSVLRTVHYQRALTPLHRRIKDKNGETVSDLLSPTSEADADVRALIRKSQVSAAVSADDVASGASYVPRSIQISCSPLDM